jgi:hypothetical protein
MRPRRSWETGGVKSKIFFMRTKDDGAGVEEGEEEVPEEG